MSTNNVIGTFLLSNAADRAEGLDWYDRAFKAAKDISIVTGVNVNRVAGVIAALSPNNRWERNLTDAENVCKAFVNGDADDVMQVKVCTYKKMLEKALLILQCENIADIPSILNGRKIRAFYECIIGNDDVVVVDGHAYSIWFGERLAMKQVPNIGVKLYKSIADDYIQATQEINSKFNMNLKPFQVQAITWIAWRRIHEV